jgi:hypothetical protein
VTCASVVWMVVTVGLHGSAYASIIDPSFAIHRAFVTDGSALTQALGLPAVDPRILLAVIATAFVLMLVALRRRLPTPWLLLALGLPLLAYGVANTGYVMTKLSLQYSAVPASHPQSLNGFDRLVPASADVGLVIAPDEPTVEPEPVNTWWTWWQPSFWNKTVQRAFIFPGDDSFAQGFVTTLHQDLVHGRLAGLDGANYLVKLMGDARFAPRGPILTPVGSLLMLYKLAPGAQLLYGTSGVDQYSRLEPGSHPFIRVFGWGAAAASERVSVTLESPAAQAECPCRIHFGSAYGDVALPAASVTPGRAVPVSRIVAVPPHGYAQLNLAVTGRDGHQLSWVTLVAVNIRNVKPRP